MIKVPDPYIPLYTTEKPIILITGGRGSAKSFQTSLFVKRLSYEKGHKILYCRYTLTAADISIIPEIVEKIEMEGDQEYFSITKKDLANSVSGSEILFRGIKTSSGNQTANLKSIQGLSTFIMDEGEEWEHEDDYDKLRLSIRQKGVRNRTIIVMNPCDSNHFVYRKYIKNSHVLKDYNGVPVQISTHPQVCHIHTTYRDNEENLSKEFIYEVEALKDAHNTLESNEQFTSKYALKIVGRWADRKEGAIFENWVEGAFDEALPYCYGQDYGYSIDPTTLIKVAVDEKRKKLYLKELFYERSKLGTDAIYELNSSLIGSLNDLIVGDSAEARLIEELRLKGLNIIEASKGPGSIKEGLTSMMDYEIVVDPNSLNLKFELNNYIWSNKKAGIPVDANNHGIDASRYAFKELSTPKMYFGG